MVYMLLSLYIGTWIKVIYIWPLLHYRVLYRIPHIYFSPGISVVSYGYLFITQQQLFASIWKMPFRVSCMACLVVMNFFYLFLNFERLLDVAFLIDTEVLLFFSCFFQYFEWNILLSSNLWSIYWKIHPPFFGCKFIHN